jgi:hypothetical protein
MSFGKRPSTSPQPAPQQQAAPRQAPLVTDPHGRRRVLPADVWEGKTGAFLRELGFDPNDESNFVANAASINARLDEQRAAFETKLAKVRTEIGSLVKGAKVTPFSLIPDPCWNGRMGQFLLMRLELYPYEDWNIAYLPADERTAFVMNAPPHPGGNIPAFVEAATAFMAKAEAALDAAYAETGRTQDFGKFADMRENIRGRVKALAAMFAGQMMEAWKTHNAQPARR